jgi:hypothetical protein
MHRVSRLAILVAAGLVIASTAPASTQTDTAAPDAMDIFIAWSDWGVAP